MNNINYFTDTSNNEHILYCSDLLTLYRGTVSINLILISLKLLKYLGAMFERITVMFKVLSHAWSDIMYFFILYLIIFISFTTTFHVFYGSQVGSFSTYNKSFNTLFLYLLKNILEIDEMKQMNFYFTMIFFIIFIVSMQFILMNMFIAIIALSYSTVNKELKEKSSFVKVLNEKHFLVKLHEFYIRITKMGCFAKWRFKKKKNNEEVEKQDDLEESIEGDQSMLRHGEYLLLTLISFYEKYSIVQHSKSFIWSVIFQKQTYI